MRTYNRICIVNKTLRFPAGEEIKLVRGKEYNTTEVNTAPSIGPDPVEGCVIVFSNYWFPCPVEYFAGEEVFTK
jgi:hypothetical protein